MQRVVAWYSLSAACRLAARSFPHRSATSAAEAASCRASLRAITSCSFLGRYGEMQGGIARYGEIVAVCAPPPAIEGDEERVGGGAEARKPVVRPLPVVGVLVGVPQLAAPHREI